MGGGQPAVDSLSGSVSGVATIAASLLSIGLVVILVVEAFKPVVTSPRARLRNVLDTHPDKAVRLVIIGCALYGSAAVSVALDPVEPAAIRVAAIPMACVLVRAAQAACHVVRVDTPL